MNLAMKLVYWVVSPLALMLLLLLVLQIFGIILYQHSSIGWHDFVSVGWVTAPL